MNDNNKFVVVDGNSLVHRAFYALPLLTTSKGYFTNAVYGFTNMILKILEDEKPRYMAVAFDKGKATYRIAEYAEYKGHRKGTPEELRPQFPMLKNVLEVLGIPIYEQEGYEADDLIGTLTARAEEEGLDNIIVTGDRDALQLVSPKTRVMITRKGISEMELYDEKGVFEKYGVVPIKVIDIKGLMGDASDNIPGVPGVGEKTAVKLIQEFGSIETLLEEVDKVKGKIQEKIRDNADLARLSKGLATIVRDIPLELDLECCKVSKPDYQQAIELFREFEFKTLVKSFSEKQKLDSIQGSKPEEQEEACPGPAPDLNYRKIITLENAKAALEALREAYEISIAIETSTGSAMGARIASFALSARPGEGYYFPCGEEISGAEVSSETTLEVLKVLMEDPKIIKNFHDYKRAKVVLRNHGIDVKGEAFDTMIAAYLLNPAGNSVQPEDAAFEYLKQSYTYESLFETAANRANLTWSLKDVLVPKLDIDQLAELYYQVELPLAGVLAEMELAGITLDVEQLKVMSFELGKRIEELTAEIYTSAGEEFNINSPKQLGYILFERLGLPVIKKTKTGYSTNAEILEELAEHHEIVEKILEYRHYTKLKSTYVDAMTSLINPKTGRIHTTLNQTVTATGRLSSTEPNLQNIPIRLELGRKIRKVFTPGREDYILVTADYSQIELRILAHISGDPNLVEAFREGQDIHTRTAAEVFGVPMEEVTSEMRRRAKAVNFGIVYGLSDFGLSRDIKVTRAEARKYIESYFDKYYGVKEYIDSVIRTARDQGYVTTLLNRRRYLPDLFSPNRNIRNFGERTAMNTPIQGSAADIIKVAMVRLDREIRERNLCTKMLLQVHDELIFEVPKEEMNEAITLIREAMEGAIELQVPLTVDLKAGPNWYDAQKI